MNRKNSCVEANIIDGCCNFPSCLSLSLSPLIQLSLFRFFQAHTQWLLCEYSLFFSLPPSHSESASFHRRRHHHHIATSQMETNRVKEKGRGEKKARGKWKREGKEKNSNESSQSLIIISALLRAYAFPQFFGFCLIPRTY